MGDVTTFIVGVELAAKKILKDANRKQKDAARREEYEAAKARKLLSSANSKHSSSGTALIPSVTERLDKKLGITMSMSSSVDAGAASQTLANTRVLQYSIPRMVVTMGTVKLDDAEGGGGDDTRPLISPRHLSPIRSRGEMKGDLMGMKKSKVQSRLEKSPYVSTLHSQSMKDITTTLKKEGGGGSSMKQGNVDEEAPGKQTDWALKQQVSAVFSGDARSPKPKPRPKHPGDSQGPIDWSSEGLRAKYRGEEQREHAWQVFQDAQAYSSSSFDDSGLVLPMIEMERHPVYVLFDRLLERMNEQSKFRTRNRLKMKRFVMDVQEVWLSNLQHLAEHQDNVDLSSSKRQTKSTMPTIPSTTNMLQLQKESEGFNPDPISDAAGVIHRRDLSDDEDEEEDAESREGTGLRRRRDVEAVLKMSSQIPSVSQKRALEGAFLTAETSAFPHMSAQVFRSSVAPAVPAIPAAEPFTLENLQIGRMISSIKGEQVLCYIDRMLPPKPPVLKRKSAKRSLVPGLDNNGETFILHEKDLNFIKDECPGIKVTTLRSFDYNISEVVLPMEPVGAAVWRMTFSRMEDGTTRQYYATESFVDFFVTAALGDMHALSAIAKEEKGEEVVEILKTHLDINWGRMDVPAEVVVQLIRPKIFDMKSAKTVGFENIRDMARVVVTATLEGDFSHIAPLQFVVSAVEFLVAVGVPYEAPNGAFSTVISTDPRCIGVDLPLPWWQLVEDESNIYAVNIHHFERFLALVVIPVGDESRQTGNPEPLGLCLIEDANRLVNPESGMPEVTKDPLSNIRASSYAHFLTNLAHVDFDTLDVSFQYAQKETMRPVELTTISWRDTLAVASGGAETGQLFRRPRFQATLTMLNSAWVKGDDEALEFVTQKFGTPYNTLEDICDDMLSLSMRVTGASNRTKLVPGSFECNKNRALWFSYPLYPEKTRVIANLFRDKNISSTDSVIINVALALDTSILAPIQLVFDPSTETPVRAPKEPAPRCYLSKVTSSPSKLFQEKLLSPILDRPSHTIMIYTTAAVEGSDYIIPTGPKPPSGMLRKLPFMDEHGFRNKTVESLLQVDVELPTIVFGVTKMAALPNATGVHTRNVWHDIVAVTDQINRLRTSKDYLYILHNEDHHGTNIPGTFRIRMHNENFGFLESSSFEIFQKKYDAISEAKAKLARQVALDAKIENSEVMLKMKDRQYLASVQEAQQRLIDKKMRKATKSEMGWKQRFYYSTLIEANTHWERRKDDRNGMFFFRRITNVDPKKERFLDTCQWTVPLDWDRDLQVDTDDKSGSEFSFGNLTGKGSGAFEQPIDTWFPNPNSDTHGAPMKDFTTPGIMATTVKKAKDFAPPMRGGDASEVTGHASDETSGIRGEGDALSGIAVNNPNASIDKIAEKLLASDALMRALCLRLGLPVSNVVDTEDMLNRSVPGSISGIENNFMGDASSVSSFGDMSGIDFQDSTRISQSMSQVNTGGVDLKFNPNRKLRADPGAVDVDGVVMDSDDDLWSDDDDQVGDTLFEGDHDLGFAPQNHGDVMLMNGEMKRREKLMPDGTKLIQGKASALKVPFLELPADGASSAAQSKSKVKNLRDMAPPRIPANFFQKCTQVRTLGPEKDIVNTLNSPVFMLPISPVDACDYIPPNFMVPIESIFIHDARKDMERVLATIERNIQKEETLAVDIPTKTLLMFGEAKEATSIDQFVATQYKQDKGEFKDAKQMAIEKAITAAKTANVSEMEDALEEEVPIDTIDQFGNSLLILAAQQGSKRMCKFLLRRGAKINMQNLVGNTVLHYCYAYSHYNLADYLKAKGADDSILNAEGLTCYEGLDRDILEEI